MQLQEALHVSGRESDLNEQMEYFYLRYQELSPVGRELTCAEAAEFAALCREALCGLAETCEEIIQDAESLPMVTGEDNDYGVCMECG